MKLHTIYQKKNTLKWLTGLSVVVLVLILFFGLRPKDFDFSNSVKRIEGQSGIRFGKYGIAYSDPIKEMREDNGIGENGFSIEIALKPLNYQEGFNFIFVFHNGVDRNQLLLGQWRSWIIVMNGDDYNHKRRVKRIAVKAVSPDPAIQFITITTGRYGTNVYLDGELVKSKNDLTLQIPYGDKARLTLGNSLYGRHSWRGDIYGFALYNHILTEQDTALHFKRWSQDRSFSFAKFGKPSVLYCFDEKEGTRVSDQAGGDHHLNIPLRMPILKKVFLSSPWRGVNINKNGIEDIVLNLVGFIPLGFVFSTTLAGFGGAFQKKAVYITLFLCVLVSLVIEIAQAWMPSRSSSQLDLMCNTAGSLIGIYMTQWIIKRGGMKKA